MSLINNIGTFIRNRLRLDTAQNKDVIQQGEKRLSYRLSRTYQYRADMRMDELRLAIQKAEDPLFPDRQQLYAIYKETLRDAHCLSQVQTLMFKICASPFMLRNRETETEDESKTKMLQSAWFNRYMKLVLESDFWGHSLMEFQQMRESHHPDLAMEFSDVILFPREHVRPETGEILLRPYDRKGIGYRDVMDSEEPFTWLLEAGNSFNLGALLVAAREVILKNYSRTDWSRHSEKFGMPFVIARTSSRNDDELNKMEYNLSNLGSNGWAILDIQDQIEYLESNRSAPHSIYKEFAKYCDEQLSKLINGQTMTSDDGSSRSQAEVHERILNNYVLARMMMLQFHINDELIPFLIRHGYPLEGFEFVFPELERGAGDKDVEVAAQNKEGERAKENFTAPVLHSEVTGFLKHVESEGCCHSEKLYNEADKEKWEGILLPIAKQIHEGKLAANQLPPELYEAVAGLLWADLVENYEGFGSVSWDMKDNAYLARVESNIFTFAAAKSFSEMNELRDYVTDENGNVRPWTEFRAYALEQNERYNLNWLDAERNAVIRAGTMGSKWNAIERDADIFPYLEYKTTGDNRVRPVHQILNGIVLPINDPFWDEFYPPNGWRCRCTAKQISQSEIDSGKYTLSESDKSIQSANELIDDEYWRKNIGKSGVIFQDGHPYYQAKPQAEIKEIGFAEYGLRKEADLYKSAKAITQKKLEEGEFDKWWESNDEGLGYFDLREVSGRMVRFNEGSKKAISQQSPAYALTLPSTINQPNELYALANGTRTYIKYYQDVAVVMQVDKDMVLKQVKVAPVRNSEGEVVLNLKAFRKGVLLKR